MLTGYEVTLLYETLLANQWMEEVVRIGLKLSRRNVLALSKLIEIGLKQENQAADALLQVMMQGGELLRGIPAEILQKADLTAMSEKLSALVAK
jgi:hypothetical protein